MPMITMYAACCWLQWIPPHERARAVSLTTSGAWQQQVQWGPAGRCAACTSSSSSNNNSEAAAAGLVLQQPTEPQHQQHQHRQPLPSVSGCIDTPLSGPLLPCPRPCARPPNRHVSWLSRRHAGAAVCGSSSWPCQPAASGGCTGPVLADAVADGGQGDPTQVGVLAHL